MEANKPLSTDLKVNQSTGLTLQKSCPWLNGRILRGSTFLATTPEESDPPQAAECHRNATLQHTAAILVDQSLHSQSPEIFSPSRCDTPSNSQHNEVERQHCLCRCSKGTEGSEKCGPRCQEGFRCKVQKRKKSECGCIHTLMSAFDDCLVDVYQADVDATTSDEIGEIPRVYRRVEIEYSKFGVEDFDFGCAQHALLRRSTYCNSASTTRHRTVGWRRIS